MFDKKGANTDGVIQNIALGQRRFPMFERPGGIRPILRAHMLENADTPALKQYGGTLMTAVSYVPSPYTAAATVAMSLLGAIYDASFEYWKSTAQQQVVLDAASLILPPANHLSRSQSLAGNFLYGDVVYVLKTSGKAA